jgi:predicted acyl esterase
MHAGSKLKYLRFATGRHDLPFYTKESVEVQKSFLDAFLKGVDTVGWSTGEAPRIELVVRKGDLGVNNPESEKEFPKRLEEAWPIPRTVYTKYHLGPDGSMAESQPALSSESRLSYQAPSGIKDEHKLQFRTKPVEREIEFTGHIVAHLNMSATAIDSTSSPPTEIDLFVTLRHISAEGKEISYTGADGDPVPICKGWLRVSLRKVNEKSSRHKTWQPYREYRSTDQQPITPGEVYAVDVELWPTSVILTPGAVLLFEISSGDTQGTGRFNHNSPIDRPVEKLRGLNHIHFVEGLENYILLPVVPPKETVNS